MKWFDNIKIRSKLFLAFGILVCIMVAFAAFSAYETYMIKDDINELIDSFQARQIYIADAISETYRMRVANLSRGYILLEGDAFAGIVTGYLETYENDAKSFLNNLAEFRKMTETDPNLTNNERGIRLAWLDSIEELNAIYEEVVGRMADLTEESDRLEIVAVFEEAIPMGTELSGQLQALRDLVFTTTTKKVLETTAHTSSIIRTVLIITAGFLVVTVVALLFTVRNINQPISQLQTAVKRITDGDLDYPIRSERKDELGTLANRIADMVEKINEHNKTEAIMDNLDTLICVSDSDYNLLFINKQLADTFNVDRQEATKHKCYKGIKNRDKPCEFCPMQELMQEKHTFPSKSFDYIWDEGQSAWVGGVASIIRWVDGSIVQIMSIRDVSERKQQEELVEKQANELALQTAKLQGIFDAIPDMIFVKGLDGRFVQCNHAMSSFFGLGNEDFIGKNELEIGFTEEETARIAEHEAPVFKEGRQIMIEEVVKGIDSTRIVETAKVPLMQNGWVIGLIGVVRDITKHKEMEEEALTASKAKSQFLANMSHEIRTPMNAILGITEIQLQNETLDNEMKDALQRIYNSGDLLLSIINDILDLSKIEAGKLELALASYKIASLINDTVTLNMMRIGSKQIEFVLSVDENTPSELIGDELRIKQILNNLLSNAFKYTEKGTVKLSIAIEAPAGETAGDGDTTLVFTVSDTGQGMTNEQVGKLFDEYSRFNIEANRTTEGTGLGMSITNNLIRMMRGAISVESEAGKGSAFTVRLPQSGTGSGVLGKQLAESLQSFESSGEKQVKKSHIIFEPMPYGSVLVVDDVESNLYVAKGLMTPYGLKIETVMSGFGAIERIQNGNAYDIIFMDHMMPVMDGIETTKKMRGLGYARPIVALTANAVVGQSDVFLSNGFDGFISKPIDVRQLNTILKKYVRDKQPPEVIEAAHRKQSAAHQTPPPPEKPGPSIPPQLAEIFIRDAKKVLAALESILAKNGAYDDDDIKLYTIHTHAMKSALANIGEKDLSAAAAKLEQAGRDKDAAAISDETAAFITGLKAVAASLAPPAEEKTGGETTDADTARLHENLRAIKEACSAFDKKTAKTALTELKETPWPDPIKQMLEAMSEHLLTGDFDEVTTLADKILKP